MISYFNNVKKLDDGANVITLGDKMEIVKSRIKDATVTIIFAVLAGTILMLLAYCVPISLIEKHVVESVNIFENEGWGYGFAPRVSTSYPDHVTDALMICEAVSPRTNSLVHDAMNNTWIGLEGYGHVDTLIHVFSDDSYDDVSVCPYPRYWHGYLIWLKPLLAIMSYSEIRILAMWIQIAFLFIALHELLEKDKRLAVAFFCSFMFLNPITSAMSMQFASIYCLTLVLTFLILKCEAYESANCWRLFMCGGIAVAFFDFFTYPVVALGIPLVICIALKKNGSIRNDLINVLDYSAAYFIGYGGMWCGKWIMAGFLIKENSVSNVFVNAFNQAVYRMVAEENESKMTAIYVLRQVLMHLNNKPMKIFALLFAVVIISIALSKQFEVSLKYKIIPIVVVAVYPFIWYILVKNHSATHARIEQREMAVFIMAMMYATLLIIKRKTPGKSNKKRVFSKREQFQKS